MIRDAAQPASLAYLYGVIADVGYMPAQMLSYALERLQAGAAQPAALAGWTQMIAFRQMMRQEWMHD